MSSLKCGALSYPSAAIGGLGSSSYFCAPPFFLFFVLFSTPYLLFAHHKSISIPHRPQTTPPGNVGCPCVSNQAGRPCCHAHVRLSNLSKTSCPSHPTSPYRSSAQAYMYLYCSFLLQVCLVHGDAVMVLHPYFTHRDSTQDIDNIHRSFIREFTALVGFRDANQRLRACV